MAALTIIGTGHMGKGIAKIALRGGYDVVFHTRDVEANRAEVQSLASSGAANITLAPEGSDITTDVVILAVPYLALGEVVASYGSKFDGKVLVDISNPVEWSEMRLIVPREGSAAQEIAALAPKAKVVKAFNTIAAGDFESGKAGGLPLDVLVAGDDSGAKQAVIDLVNAGGLRGLDAGPLAEAGALESFKHLQMSMPNQTGRLAIKLLSD